MELTALVAALSTWLGWVGMGRHMGRGKHRA